jgi:hypothetical protein
MLLFIKETMKSTKHECNYIEKCLEVYSDLAGSGYTSGVTD